MAPLRWWNIGVSIKIIRMEIEDYRTLKTKSFGILYYYFIHSYLSQISVEIQFFVPKFLQF